MFRLNTNMNAMTAMNRLRASGADAAKRVERLSTGLRINSAGDDAAGLAASEGMRSQLAGQTTSAENIGRAVAMLQTADSGLEQIGNLLVRLKELAIQSADGTITTENRSGISSEAAGLISEIDRIADATEFNGISLLQSAGLATTGARTNLTFFIGDGTSASGQTATLQLKGVQFVASTGMGTVGDTGIGLTVADFLGQTSAANLVTGIDTSIDEIANERGFAAKTIVVHLEKIGRVDPDFNLDSLLPTEDRITTIEAALKSNDSGYLAPVKELLGESYSYEEIRMVRLQMERIIKAVEK